jgi:hypothetical protein
MAVRSYQWCADYFGVSLRTWKRLLAKGEGPPVIETSARGRGHDDGDIETWKRRRKRPTSAKRIAAPVIESEIISNP